MSLSAHFLHHSSIPTCKLWNALSARSENPFKGSFGSPSTVRGSCGLAWGRSLSSHPWSMLSFTWKNPRSDLWSKKLGLLVVIIIVLMFYINKKNIMCELGVLRNFCSSVQLSLTVLVFGVHGKNIFPIYINRNNAFRWNCEVSFFYIFIHCSNFLKKQWNWNTSLNV